MTCIAVLSFFPDLGLVGKYACSAALQRCVILMTLGPWIVTLVMRLTAVAPLPLARIQIGILFKWWNAVLKYVVIAGNAPL